RVTSLAKASRWAVVQFRAPESQASASGTTRDLVETRIGRLARQSLRHLAEATLEPGPADRLRALLAEITGTPRPRPRPDGPLLTPAPAAATGSEAPR
ncbi:hypothetical protein AB0D38_43610, partial [Streptomyces sp. NPDC048279]